MNIFLHLFTVSSIEKQTKTRAKWPLQNIEMNAANTATNTANNSASSTPLPPPLNVGGGGGGGGSNLSGDKEDTSSLTSKYSSLMGDSIDGSSTGGGGGNNTNSTTTANVNNRYRTEKKITAKVSYQTFLFPFLIILKIDHSKHSNFYNKTKILFFYNIFKI